MSAVERSGTSALGVPAQIGERNPFVQPPRRAGPMCPAAVNGKCPCSRPVNGKMLSFRASAHTGVGISVRTVVRKPLQRLPQPVCGLVRNDNPGWLVRRGDVGIAPYNGLPYQFKKTAAA